MTIYKWRCHRCGIILTAYSEDECRRDKTLHEEWEKQATIYRAYKHEETETPRVEVWIE